ncbi:MAG TPA: DUF5667 domain-containing protein [Candidatus Paceibacterota bacterium]|nr:DUF5667 domain-containing protein [Candidatus Paceibacterota bacterium]
MDQKLKEFFQKAKRVQMQKEEKSLGLKALLSYIEENPVRFGDNTRRQVQRSIISDLQRFLQLLYKPMAVALVLLITVAVSGGASLAAENALPGDILYPVKTEVNEGVRSFLSFSAETRTNWKVEQVERRLQEAEELAAKGKFSGKASAELDAKVEQHAEQLSQMASRFNSQGRADLAAEIHSDLEATFDAHGKVLGLVRGEVNGLELSEFISVVRTRATTARQARQEAEVEVQAQGGTQQRQAAEGKMSAAENKIAEVKNFIAAKAKTQAETDAEVKLQAAESAFANGSAKLQAGSYGEAFVLFQQAMRVAQEAKAYAQADAVLEIKIEAGLQL